MAALTIGTLAFAQTSSPGVDLAWSAPAQCPSRAAVLGEIQSILEGGAASTHAVLATAAVERDGPRWRVALSIRSDQGSGVRALDADSCAALASAVALIVALAVDPTRRALPRRMTRWPRSRRRRPMTSSRRRISCATPTRRRARGIPYARSRSSTSTPVASPGASSAKSVTQSVCSRSARRAGPPTPTRQRNDSSPRGPAPRWPVASDRRAAGPESWRVDFGDLFLTVRPQRRPRRDKRLLRCLRKGIT